MKMYDINTEMLEMLNGDINPLRDYYITLGQSSSSKGVMFVLYSVLKKCTSPHVNPYCYLGQLSDNLGDAIISARKKIGKFKIEIIDAETLRVRKLPDVIGFGKYNGKTIEEIFDIDFKYVYWLSTKSNNGELTVNQKLHNTLKNYYDISKELIIEENKKKSNTSLPIDLKLVERTFTCYSSRTNFEYTIQRFKDVDGNIFQYQGKKLAEKEGDIITIKCKVKSSYEYMGYTYNKINLR